MNLPVWIEHWASELRYALRMIRRTPGLSAVAVLSLALGARRGEVLWLVVRDAAVLVAAGAAIGMPAALALTRLVQTFLFGVSAQDPWSMAGGAVVLAAVAALASILPARRAARVDPAVMLRYE